MDQAPQTLSIEAFLDHPEVSFELHRRARRNRSVVVGRLIARFFARVTATIAALRPTPRPLSQTLAHWG